MRGRNRHARKSALVPLTAAQLLATGAQTKSVLPYFFFGLAAPCLTAADPQASTLPPDVLPFLNCLPASVSSFLVGGLIFSFFIIAYC